MLDEDVLIGGYKKEDDYTDGDFKDKPNDSGNNFLMRNDFENFMTEETSEPDIMFWCKDNTEASQLLRKCIKLMNEKNWLTMRRYLKEIVDIENDISLLDNGSNDGSKINKVGFVKNFYLGVAHFKIGEYEEALQCFFEANKIYQYYQLNYNIALCYIKLGNLENAVFYLEAVTKKNKNFFFAYYNLIKIYLKKNNINDAYLIYRDFSDIIKKEKDKEKYSAQMDILPSNRLSAASFNALKLFHKLGAECCFAKGLYQECVHTILEALKFNPEDPELWCLYAKVFIMKKSFDYAKPLLEKALEMDPKYIEAQDLLTILINNQA